MKRKIIHSVSLLLIALTLAFNLLPQKQTVSAQNPQQQNITVDKAKVLEARFLNMLNHSFVYNDAIFFEEDIVNNSILALLNLRDSEDDAYIKQDYVSNYIFNMYGVENIDYSLINKDFDQKEGFVYIIPRGYSVFKHKIISVSENEDGSYTVKTKVTISAHDSDEITEECTTLFVKNESSKFGYNIISSVIETEKTSI